MGEKDNVKDLEIKNEKMYDVAEIKRNSGIATLNLIFEYGFFSTVSKGIRLNSFNDIQFDI